MCTLTNPYSSSRFYGPFAGGVVVRGIGQARTVDISEVEHRVHDFGIGQRFSLDAIDGG